MVVQQNRNLTTDIPDLCLYKSICMHIFVTNKKISCVLQNPTLLTMDITAQSRIKRIAKGSGRSLRQVYSAKDLCFF